MLGQVSEETAGSVFRDYLRGAVRGMICEAMAQEVTELCGGKHHPTEGEHFRAGSSPGRVLYEGEREEVVRPRVRRRESDGSSSEVLLSTYAAARCPRQLQESIVQALMCGVSTREVSQVHGESAPGLSKSK
jgi:transposase-like protein